MRIHGELTAEVLRELFLYDPDTGDFYARTNTPRGLKLGERAGYLNDSGYMMVSINRRNYRAHRLAWLYVYGVWPSETIDHINHDRTDNRIDNLRDVSIGLNSHNRGGPSSHNKLGVLGVQRSRGSGRFMAVAVVKGKRKQVGTFDTPEQAHSAYMAAKREAGLLPA
jgi:hypothetical protein